METKIVLVRHAECEGNVQNRLSGITNFKLTSNGKKQAKDVAEKLKGQKIDKVYSSPLDRALQTAQEISKYAHEKYVLIENDLIEINYGKCDGMQWVEINTKYPNVKKMWKEIKNYPNGMPEQEEYINVQKRMVKIINDIADKNRGKKICIVSHGIAIQSFLCYFYHKDITEANLLPQLKNAEFITISIDKLN